MKGTGFEITGIKEVRNILEEVAPKHARNLMRATIHGVASEIAKDAKASAPKDTGALRKAIKAKRKKSAPDRPVSEVFVEHGGNAKHDAFYWRFIEYGTGGKTAQPERPFIRPATDKARANLDQIITQQFGKKLEAALRREAKKKARK
jgi:HK97 gp10 family phage protein